MGSNYKSKTYFLSIFSELMKSIQKPIQPGERFPYVIVVDHKGRDKIGEKMRTNAMFNEQWEDLNYHLGIPENYIPKRR